MVKDTGFVDGALRQAVAVRIGEGHPSPNAIHHQDSGRHYTAMYYGRTLMLDGLSHRSGLPATRAR